MRFTARSMALVSAAALTAVGLSTVPASAAASTLTVGSTATYNKASTTEAVSGTSVNAGDTIALTLTDGSATTATRTATAASDKTWSYAFTASDVQALADGTITVKASETYNGQISSSGCGLLGLGPCYGPITQTDTKAFTKDTVAPGAPSIESVPSQTSSANGVINSATKDPVTATGAGTGGNGLTFTLGGVTASTTVTSSGNWALTTNALGLADGTYTASAVQTDAVGNPSPAGTFQVIKDTVGPRTNITSPISGTTVAPPNTVGFTYHDTLATTSTIEVTTGSTTVDGTIAVSAGTVSFKPTTALRSGSYTAKATAYDVYGNKTLTTISFTVDASAPAVTGLTSTKTSVSTANTTVTGTVSEAATLTITSTDSVGGKATKTIDSAPAGTFSATYSENALAAGTITVTVKAVDVVGNTSTTTTTHTRTAPATTVITIAVPSWSGVDWPITITGNVHLAKAATYGSVTLVHSSLSGNSQILARAVSVSSTGAYSFKYTPTTSGTYYAIYNGDSKNSGTQSATVSSQVRYAISASSSTGPATEKALISGAVHWPPSGAYVLAYRKNADGSWSQIGKAYIDSTHHYRLSAQLPKGTSTIRVDIPASHGYYGNSANLTVTRS